MKREKKIQMKRHVNKYCLQGLNRSGAKTQELGRKRRIK